MAATSQYGPVANKEDDLPQVSPSRIAEKIVIRLPSGMRERIKRSATKNARSANAEVVFYLERIFGASASAGPEFGDDSPADVSPHPVDAGGSANAS